MKKLLPVLLVVSLLVTGRQTIYAGVVDNTGTSHLELLVGEPKADSSDTLFGLLYDILAKLTKLDTINESIVAMKESVDKMETSQTNVQYVVNSLAGNQVSITAPTMQNVKSTLSANIDQNANDYIFTDPANGISYSVVNYDPITDELTLFMRQIIGEYRQDTLGAPYDTSIAFEYNGSAYEYRYYTSATSYVVLPNYSFWSVANWHLPEPNAYYEAFVSTLSDKGILSRVTSVNRLHQTLYVNNLPSTVLKQIPSNSRICPSGNTIDTYWCGEDTNYTMLGNEELYTDYIDCNTGSVQSVRYMSVSGSVSRDSGSRGITAILKLQGDLGDLNYVKEVCPDWFKMYNTSIGSTGIEVFDTGYLLDVISTEVGTLRTYQDSTHKYKHDLYVNTSENNLTSSVSNALLTGAAGGKFSIPYTSTMSTKTFTNEATLGTNHQKYVDVIIRDPSDKILYFGRIAKAKLGDNLITFTLPNDLQEDVPYLLQMFEESYYDHQGISTISTPVNARLVISNE